MAERPGMTLREQLHRLADELVQDSAKPRLHANIDALTDDQLPEALERLQMLRRLSQADQG